MRRSSSPDWGGNYPPGAKNDPRAPYNQPDRSHEHEWRPTDPDHRGRNQPIIEDGAAIFHEECNYAEGRHGEGWQCEETRTYRFEYSTLESPDGEEWELPDITEWDDHDLPEEVAERVITIEERHCYIGPGDEETPIDVDPDPECGVVTIEHDGWTLRFEP